MAETKTRPRGELISAFREGFPKGYTPITKEGEAGFDTGIDFGIHMLAAGQVFTERHTKEAVWVLLDGKAELEFDGKTETVERSSLFDEAATALHVGPEEVLKITSSTDTEWGVARAANTSKFPPRLFKPAEIVPEFRGKGLAQDACLRNVQLIFDKDSRPESNLVIGEVVNYPGRWSSYPPHHHEQSEIYHYRFTEPAGYGHGECGDEVFKLRGRDTLKIPGGLDHAQVSAPGYGMYYLWIVRHLDGNPYTGFTYSPEHEWLLDPKKQGWKPK